MYRFPGYVDYHKENDGIYVTSNLYGNVIRLTDYAVKQEFEDLVEQSGCEKLETPLTNLLHEQRLLLNDTEFNQTMTEIRKLMDDIFTISILPTEGCNFRCPYCYEDHNSARMSREILNQIKKYIVEQIPKYSKVNLGWFGGEPTLCKDIVLEICTLFQTLKVKYGFEFYSNMTTNGYLLDEKTFCQFYKLGITSYHITLDGWNHDKTRPKASGEGTLKTILRNLISISNLDKSEYHFQITIRHNILAGDHDYSWYDFLFRLFGQDERFQIYIHPVDDWGGKSVHGLNLISEDDKNRVVREHIEYLTRIGMKCSNTQKDNKLFGHVCYACRPNAVVFRCNGMIEKCTLSLGHPKNRLGWIDPKKGVVINSDINQLWGFSELKPECRSCPDLLQCMNLRCGRSRMISNKGTEPCNLARLNLY